MRETILNFFKIAGFEITNDDSHLFEDLLLDDLDFISISLRIEEEFNIKFRDDLLERVNTFRKLLVLTENTINNG